MNLEADPSVGVQVGTRRFTARARVASSAERATVAKATGNASTTVLSKTVPITWKADQIDGPEFRTNIRILSPRSPRAPSRSPTSIRRAWTNSSKRCAGST